MKIEVFLVFNFKAVNDLFVTAATQGDSSQGLGFASGEQGRTVNDRKDVDFAGDVANVIQAASIHTVVLFEDRFTDVAANQLFISIFKPLFFFGKGLFPIRGEILFQHFCLCGVESVLSFLLSKDHRGFSDPGTEICFHSGDYLFRDTNEDHFHFCLAGFGNEVILQGAELFDLFVACVNGVQHQLFVQFLGSGFNHDHGAGGTTY